VHLCLYFQIDFQLSAYLRHDPRYELGKLDAILESQVNQACCWLDEAFSVQKREQLFVPDQLEMWK